MRSPGARHRRPGLLVATLALGLGVTAGIGACGLPDTSRPAAPSPSGGPQAPTGAVRSPATGPEPTGAAPQATGKRLPGMSLTELEERAAGKQAGAQPAPTQTSPLKGTWFIGELGTYLVGRGIP